ncbi:MAG TPA: 30S ribosomal protein S17 [Solirubrobacteraceae bacterium]|jgi:small subunit ribosomal protein S17|nr:30S ribosomal protein S17 [Solirubrobacteraceae bacterium]
MAEEDTDVETTPEAPAATPAEPQEVVSPKERRSRTRAGKAAKAPVAKTLTPEERHAVRVGERRHKADERRSGRLKAREKAKASGTTAAATPAREHVQGKQKSRQGVVVSDRAAKTITVRVDVAHRHRRYQKVVRTSMTLHAHDEREDAHIGDTVLVRESRPLSRTKRWRLIEVLERAR